MEIENLKKRSEVRQRIPQSESVMESELNEVLLRQGLRFQKQFPIGLFFADLALPEIMLAVEYDGKEFHQDEAKDERRDAFMAKEGWMVLRVNKAAHLFCLHEGKREIAAGSMELIGQEIEEIAEHRKYKFGREIKRGYQEGAHFESVDFGSGYRRLERKVLKNYEHG